MDGRQESVRKEYIQLLKKLTDCVLKGNTESIRIICESLLKIICSENHEFILSIQNDTGNPLSKSNLIIFACKHEQSKVLEYMFGDGQKMLINLYERIGIDLIHPSYSDSYKHNAFYYAMRSNDVKLVDLLIEKWPRFNLGKNIECFEDILSGSYQDLSLRNVPLSSEMHFCVESRLLDFRLAISKNLLSPEITSTQIIARVDWLISKIHRTLDEDSGDKTDIFLHNLKTIAKNIHVLKTSLRHTYDVIPWEEMEFCLLTFVRARIRKDELNILYWSFITKRALVSHLKNFTKCLKAEKNSILDKQSVDTLKTFPTIKRKQAILLIIKKYPFFQTLYNDFERTRDIRSLAVMNDYMNVSLTADIEEKNGRYVIVRTLQVVSQCFKNTFEAPMLTDEARKRLLSNLVVDSGKLPIVLNTGRFEEVNMREIIIGIRNSLSSSFVLSKKAEKDDKDTIEYFEKIIIGIKRLSMVVKNIISTDIFLQTKRYFRILEDCNDLDSVEEIMKLFRSMKFDDLVLTGNFSMLQELVNKLVEEGKIQLHSFYLIQTVNSNMTRIRRSRHMLDVDLEKLKSIMKQWVMHTGLNIIGNNEYKLEKVRSGAKELVEMFSNFETPNLSTTLGFEQLIGCLDTVASRSSKQTYYDAYMLTCNAINIIDLLDEHSELDEKLHTGLKNHNIKFPFDSFDPELSPEKIEKGHAADRTSEIKHIIQVGNGGNKTKNYHLPHEESKGTQLILELLMVETLYAMGYTQNCGTNHHAYIDARVPILYGADLLDHLTQKTDIVDVCSDNSATCVVSNARLIVSGNFEKHPIDQTLFDVNELIDRDCQINNVVCFQHQLFQALFDGKMETTNLCLENGSDIFGRNYDNNTALHYAAKEPSSGSLEYIVDQWKCKIDQRNNDGMNPLHLAAYNGYAENVKLLLNRGKMSVDTVDEFGRTALHYSVSTKFINVTKMLLMFMADPNTISQEGQTPLEQALYSKNVEASKVILEHTNFCYNDTIGKTPLGVASENGLLELLPALMKLEAKRSEPRKSSAAIKPPTPLHYAAKNGHIECLKILLQNGWDLNAEAVDGATPLYFGVLSDKEEVVRFLLNKGADARYGKIIFCAAVKGNKKIMEMLISAKAPVNVTEMVSGRTPLHIVAGQNRKDLVELLLENGIYVNAKDNLGLTALHYCATKGHYKLSKLLMKYGAKTNIGDELNYTPHFYAVLEGHQNIVEVMVTNTNINDVESSGYTALHISCNRGFTGIARYLLGKGAEVNAKANNGRTSLHMAILKGHREIVTLLLKKGASIHDGDGQGRTSVHLAAMVGQAKVIEMLIKLGVDVNKVDPNGWTPLHIGCDNGSLECASQLIDKGCSVNKTADLGITPLFLSVRSNNINIVKLLVNKKVKLDENALRETAKKGFVDIMELLLDSFPNSSNAKELLSIAVVRRQPEIIKMLVNRGADVNAETESDVKPLHLAALTGGCEIIQLLLELGADPNGKSREGKTPLLLAAEVGHRNSVVTLLTHESKILAESSEGRTPLSIAIEKGHTSIVDLFLNHNKSININDYFATERRLPLLHLAVLSGNIEVVKLLIQKGANIDKKHEGWKAIHYAAINGYADIVKFFLSIGMDLYDSPGNGDNLLHLLAHGGGDCLSVAKLLVCEKRMDLNRCNYSGQSPLQCAVLLTGGIELIKFFLENGSYYDKIIARGITMSIPIRLTFDSVQQLFTEAKRGDLLQVQNSIKRGAVVNVRNERNETPLLCSTWKGKANIVHELLAKGANPDLANKSGSTPLHYASKFSYYSIVIALLESGSVFEPINNASKTPLDYATDLKISKFLKLIEHTFLMIKSRDIEILDTLQKMKLRPDEVRALVNCRNREGKTIMAFALLSKFPDVRRLRSVFCNNQNLERAKKSLYMERSVESLVCTRLERQHPKSLLFNDDSMINIELDLVIALSLCEEQEYEEGISELEKIYEICKKMMGENEGLTIAVESLRALALMKKGESKCALKLLQNIIERQRAVLSPLHVDLIKTEILVSKGLYLSGKLDEALKINYGLIERFELIKGSENPIEYEIKNDIAMILLEKGKLDEALNLLKQVLEKRNLTLGPKHRETLQTMVNIGFVYAAQRKFKESLQIIVNAIKVQWKVLDKSCWDEEYDVRKILFVLLRDDKRANVFKTKIYREDQDNREIWFPSLVNFFERLERLHFGGHDNEGSHRRTNEVEENLFNIIAKGGNIMRINHVKGRTTVDSSPLNEKDVPFFSKLLGGEVMWSSNDSPKEERIDKLVFQAISRGDMAVVNKLFEGGMDLNATDEEGRTALHYAVSSGNVSIVESLMNRGAKVNVKSKKGNTPLHTAALLGGADISEILLKRVKVTEIRDFVDSKTFKSGMTALHIAASKGKLEVAEILLKYGATFNVMNTEDKIPLDLSINEEVSSILRKLDKVFSTVTATSSSLSECDEDMKNILRASRNADGRVFLTEIVKCKEFVDKMV